MTEFKNGQRLRFAGEPAPVAYIGPIPGSADSHIVMSCYGSPWVVLSKDLTEIPKKRKVWVNLYRFIDSEYVYTDTFCEKKIAERVGYGGGIVVVKRAHEIEYEAKE